MNLWYETVIITGITLFGLFMTLYLGESTFKFNNKTLKQTIHDLLHKNEDLKGG